MFFPYIFPYKIILKGKRWYPIIGKVDCFLSGNLPLQTGISSAILIAMIGKGVKAVGEGKKMNKATDTAKERLLQAAVKLFAEQPYDATTTRQIAMEAGSSISMLNLHFGSKENLYRKALEHVIDVFAIQNFSLFGEIIEARHQKDLPQEEIWRFIEQLTTVLVDITHDPKYKNEVLLLNRELQNWEHGFQYVEPILLFYYNYALLFDAYAGAPEGSLWAKELSFATITGVFRNACYPSLRKHLLADCDEGSLQETAEEAQKYHLFAIRNVLDTRVTT